MPNTVYDSDQQEQQGTDSRPSVSPEQVRDLERSFAAPAYGEGAAKGPKNNDGGASKWEDPDKQGERGNSKDKHTPSPQELGTQERQPSSQNTATAADSRESEQLFTGGNKRGGTKKGHGFWNKKRAGIAGGIAGGLLGGGVLGLTMISGPLEFVHIAQLLENSHFSHQEDAGDNRLGHMYRYLRTGNIGETRLNFLESKYHNKIVSKLGNAGIELKYGAGNTYNGLTIDPEKNSAFKNMSLEEFEKQTGIKVTVEGGKWQVHDINGFWKQRSSLRVALNSLGDSKIATVVRMRNLGKFGLISWHPLNIIDRQVYKGASAITDYMKKKWSSRINAGQEPVTVQAATKDDKGNPIKDPVSTEVIGESNKAIQGGGLKEAVSRIRSGVAGKAAVGVLGAPSAALAVVCALKSIDDNVVTIRYAQVILPLIRLGMNTISVGNQIMRGQDVDPDELKYLATSFNDIDSKGKTLSTWDQARSIRANAGQSGGIDAMKESGERDIITQAHIAALKWTQSPPIPQACSTVGQVVVGAVSIVLTVVTAGTTDLLGNLATGLVQGVLIGGFTEVAVNLFSNILAGDGIAAARGALWGSQIDYGAALGSNVTSLWSAGVALKPAQVAELNAVSNSEDQQDFQSQSLASRLFNPYDRKSLISRALIDNQNPDVTQNVANITEGFMHVGSSLLKLPGALFSSAQAAPTTPYDYGFPEYGFSEEDLSNPAVDDPFTNAADVAKVLDSDQGPNYIAQAAKCFAVNIVKQPEASAGGAQLWNVLPTDQTNPETFDPYNSVKYSPDDCTHPTNLDATNWLKLRFFILDTGTMEGYACAELDDSQSCANDGMDDSGGTALENNKASANDYAVGTKPSTQPSVATAKEPFVNPLASLAAGTYSTPTPFGMPSLDLRNRIVGSIL
jgi:hypothetical protein